MFGLGSDLPNTSIQLFIKKNTSIHLFKQSTIQVYTYEKSVFRKRAPLDIVINGIVLGFYPISVLLQYWVLLTSFLRIFSLRTEHKSIMDVAVDVVIVGAGIAGLTTSLGLYRYPSSNQNSPFL